MNLIDTKNKLNYHREFLRLLTILEVRAARKYVPILAAQYNGAARAVAAGNSPIGAINTQNSQLKTALFNNYMVAGKTFGDIVLDEIKKTRATPKEDFYAELRAYAKTWSAIRVTEITNTTKKAIALIIRKGMESELTNREIAKNILQTGKITSKTRAATIARTETHSAATSSIHDAMVKTGFMETHTWVSVADKSTRAAHLVAHGQTKKIDEPFIVWGEKLMWPGIPTGTAKNIIKCRCAEAFGTKKRKKAA